MGLSPHWRVPHSCCWARLRLFLDWSRRQAAPKKSLGVLDLSSKERFLESAERLSALVTGLSVDEAATILAHAWQDYSFSIGQQAHIVAVDEHTVECFAVGRYSPKFYIFLGLHRHGAILEALAV